MEASSMRCLRLVVGLYIGVLTVGLLIIGPMVWGRTSVAWFFLLIAPLVLGYKFSGNPRFRYNHLGAVILVVFAAVIFACP